jgi:hypothetical protein
MLHASPQTALYHFHVLMNNAFASKTSQNSFNHLFRRWNG